MVAWYEYCFALLALEYHKLVLCTVQGGLRQDRGGGQEGMGAKRGGRGRLLLRPAYGPYQASGTAGASRQSSPGGVQVECRWSAGRVVRPCHARAIISGPNRAIAPPARDPLFPPPMAERSGPLSACSFPNSQPILATALSKVEKRPTQRLLNSWQRQAARLVLVKSERVSWAWMTRCFGQSTLHC